MLDSLPMVDGISSDGSSLCSEVETSGLRVWGMWVWLRKWVGTVAGCGHCVAVGNQTTSCVGYASRVENKASLHLETKEKC